MKRAVLLLLSLVCVSVVSAQRVQTISGEYTYYAPENVSLEQAKRTAIERAKIEAIAAEFGTNISQTNTSSVVNSDTESSSKFSSIGLTEVKGDWLADTKEPVIVINYDDGMLVVTAKVEGKVRERVNAEYDLEISTLCNGVESEVFRNNDRFAVRFRTSKKGYIAIFLIDDNVEQAYCLLPYETADGTSREVSNKEEYIFLSTQDPTYPYREETILTTDREIDHNRLIIIFSTNEFYMPLTDRGEFLPELDLERFDKWLNKNRVRDEYMSVITKILEIKAN